MPAAPQARSAAPPPVPSASPLPGAQGAAPRAPESSPPPSREVEGAIDTAIAYPYERMPTSYLFVNGKTYEYVKLGKDPLLDGEIRLDDGKTVRVDAFFKAHLGEIGGKLPRGMKERTPVVGYGSNGAPSALRRKYAAPSFPRGWSVVPVLKGKLHDFEVVHAAHYYTNGNLPATIQYARGAVQETHVTMLDEEELAHMHATEGIDTTSKRTWYSYGRLSNIELTIDAGPVLKEAEVYVDNYGAVAVAGKTYALTAITGATLSPKATQEEILELTEREVRAIAETPEAEASCAALAGVKRFLCASFASPCVRDGRTAVLQQKKMFVPFSLPAASGISYKVLAGTEVPGDPDAFPASAAARRSPERGADRRSGRCSSRCRSGILDLFPKLAPAAVHGRPFTYIGTTTAITPTSSTGEVVDGATAVVDGATAVVAGAGEVVEGSTAVVEGAGEVVEGSTAVVEGAGEVVEGSTAIVDGSTAVVEGAGEVVEGSTAVVVGSTAVVDGSTAVVDGSSAVVDGSSAVVDGSSAVVDGSSAAVDGAGEVVDGAGEVVDGAGKVVDGVEHHHFRTALRQQADPSRAASASGRSAAQGCSFSGAARPLNTR